jgi:hypothetical protein
LIELSFNHPLKVVEQSHNGELKRLNWLLAKYQKTAGSEIDYTFIDAQTAHEWNAP